MKTKEEIEETLAEILDTCMAFGNQDGSIISLDYDEERQEAIVRLTVVINEENDYVAFQGY